MGMQPKRERAASSVTEKKGKGCRAEEAQMEEADVSHAEDESVQERRKERRHRAAKEAAEQTKEPAEEEQEEQSEKKANEERRKKKRRAREAEEEVGAHEQDDSREAAAKKERRKEKRRAKEAEEAVGAHEEEESEEATAKKERRKEKRRAKDAEETQESEESEEAAAKKERRKEKRRAKEAAEDEAAEEERRKEKKKRAHETIEKAEKGEEAADMEASEEENKKQEKTKRKKSKAAETTFSSGTQEEDLMEVSPPRGKKRRSPVPSDHEGAEEQRTSPKRPKTTGQKKAAPTETWSGTETGAGTEDLGTPLPPDFAEVHVTGAGADSDRLKPWAQFEDVGKGDLKVSIPPRAVNYLVKDKCFRRPTVIQAYCWPIACAERDLVGIAKTGSGKTLAYLLPSFPLILASKSRRDSSSSISTGGGGPYVLVLAPTRELAVQIEQEALAFQSCLGIRTVCVYGGAGKGPQIGALSRGANVVVATAGRLNDFLENKCKYTGKPILSISNASYVVLDEADRMLDMGFEPQIRKIFEYLPKKRQTLLFSATWPKEIRDLAYEFLTDPVHVRVGSCDAFQGNGDVEQRVLLLEADAKTGSAEEGVKKKELRRILKEHDGEMCLVFCGMKKTAATVADELWRDGVKAMGLHGDMDQWGREGTLHSFKTGETKVLVATDVAARGLDVQGIAVVVNYDPAPQVDDHVHRIGRTGRAGKKGLAYTMLGKEEVKFAKDIVKVMRSAGQMVPADLAELASWQVQSCKARKNAKWWGRAWW